MLKSNLPPEFPEGLTITIYPAEKETSSEVYLLAMEYKSKYGVFHKSAYFDKTLTDRMCTGTIDATKIIMAESAHSLGKDLEDQSLYDLRDALLDWHPS